MLQQNHEIMKYQFVFQWNVYCHVLHQHSWNFQQSDKINPVCIIYYYFFTFTCIVVEK